MSTRVGQHADQWGSTQSQTSTENVLIAFLSNVLIVGAETRKDKTIMCEVSADN